MCVSSLPRVRLGPFLRRELSALTGHRAAHLAGHSRRRIAHTRSGPSTSMAHVAATTMHRFLGSCKSAMNDSLRKKVHFLMSPHGAWGTLPIPPQATTQLVVSVGRTPPIRRRAASLSHLEPTCSCNKLEQCSVSREVSGDTDHSTSHRSARGTSQSGQSSTRAAVHNRPRCFIRRVQPLCPPY